MLNPLRRARFDYFLVWGHGVPHLDKMLAMIRSDPALKVVTILHHRPESVEALVTAVYSFDYAPIEHLRGKTEYLKGTPPECYFIFVANSAPDEEYFGEGAYRHIESRSVKHLKERIRDLCNPRVDGRRSEEHVIHASDNEMQTDQILRYLGQPGVEWFADRHLALRAPFHLQAVTDYCITELPMASLYCRIVTGERLCHGSELIPVEETPHFRALQGDHDCYRSYLERYLGTALCDDHTLEKLLGLTESFQYLQPPFDSDYVIVQETGEGKFAVLDGTHRVAVLKHQGAAALLVAVV